MVILTASEINKSFGIDQILKGVSFHVEKGDRIGIVGDNGAGKTTLLSILAGESPADDGDVFFASGITIGYLRQRDNFQSRSTVYEEMLSLFTSLLEEETALAVLSQEIALRSATGDDVESMLHAYHDRSEAFAAKGGYRFRGEIDGILSSMAFPKEYYEKRIDTLSGGERTRLALASLLLQKPDLLLLDEPTNHLDIGTLKWLESFLATYNGTVAVVSHDRYFLDQIVTRIFEIEHRQLTVYEGNYSIYAEKKRQREESMLRSYENQQREIKRQEEMIRRFRQHGTEKLAKRARSREKRLDHIVQLDRPEGRGGPMKLVFKERYKSGTDVLSCSGLSKSFFGSDGTRVLFRNVALDIKRGERICMVGQNGIGKTTLLRILLGQADPDTGMVRIGHNVVFGYYDQEQQLLTENRTVIDELWEAHRLYTEGELRGILGRFLFRNDDVFKQISMLSGGEKARLSLLKLMLSGANVLVMDEPTNHLDIRSKEVFEDALLSYQGTLLIVSHDRYLLNKIPSKIIELSADGIESYLGGYDYYMEKKMSISSGKTHLADLSKSVTAISGSSSDPAVAMSKEQKQEDRRLAKAAEADRRRQEKELIALEEEIRTLEESLVSLEDSLCKEEIATDPAELTRLAEKIEAVKRSLDSNYERWIALQ
ncbi:MAG: ABC transporter ATP-binding protein [Firmicutes bacterium HGW-Firmicutes-11]|jgi:ATP-binding cassette subfamily F protein 3|nr:MAG: ABC transporter ATP-binding protein [Firmicutes bacterium HGW-Firmicutes-11]